MPESDAEVLLYQAKEVKQFMEHDAVRRAFTATEEQIKRKWEAAETPLEREYQWHKLKAFKELQRELRSAGDRRPGPELAP